MTIYFWFVPVFALLVLGVVVLYFIVARGLPKTSDRSVSDALADDEPLNPMTKTELPADHHE